MNKLFEDFSKPSYADWVNQLNKDLKGQPEELIQRKDVVEELDFNSYQHQDSENTAANESLEDPYVRGHYNATNAWENVATILVEDAKIANKEALEALNLGATALRFILPSTIDFQVLTKEIQLPFIQTTFAITSLATLQQALKDFSEEELAQIHFELDPHLASIDWNTLAQLLKTKQVFTLVANGYAIQQTGATTWQETAFMLATAHEAFVQLIEQGLTIDQAAACIHFNVGAGATYFYEIAKIRAVRVLWNKIIESYNPKHACSRAMRITGITGFTNKSLKDPHTNLLRQTTEAMSLAFAGVTQICVQPYDLYSTNRATRLSKRMAINIPLILQEESYLDKVIDPTGGSYVVEYLTNQIADKAWSLFQQIEEKGGIFTADSKAFLSEAIAAKATLRKQRIADKTDTLIGINIFPNPTDEQNSWNSMSTYFGLDQLILEQSI